MNFFSQCSKFLISWNQRKCLVEAHLNKEPAEEIISPHYLALTQQILWGAFFLRTSSSWKSYWEGTSATWKFLKNIKSIEKGQNRVSKNCFENLNTSKNAYLAKSFSESATYVTYLDYMLDLLCQVIIIWLKIMRFIRLV